MTSAEGQYREHIKHWDAEDEFLFALKENSLQAMAVVAADGQSGTALRQTRLRLGILVEKDMYALDVLSVLVGCDLFPRPLETFAKMRN